MFHFSRKIYACYSSEKNWVVKKSSTWSDLAMALAAYSIVLENNQKQKGVQDWLGGFHITLEPHFWYCVCLVYLPSLYPICSEDFPHDTL